MNTLSRAITAQLLDNPHTYLALQQHWSALMNSERKHELSAAHHLLYLALRGKDWRKAFTPLTNRRKLENGAFYDWGLFRALRALHRPGNETWLLAPFDGLLTPAMLQRIREMIPFSRCWTASRPEDFAAGAFPCEAYQLPQAAAAAAATQDQSHA